MFLSLVGLVSVCAKFQLPSLSRSGLKSSCCWGGDMGCGGVWCGGAVCGVVEAILAFRLILSQAEPFLLLFK